EIEKKADGDVHAAAGEGQTAVGEVHAAPGEPEHVKECGHFFLFHRARRWNDKENVWMGWERKRGKLEDFNEALRGKTGRFDSIVGPTARLEGIRYVIALD